MPFGERVALGILAGAFALLVASCGGGGEESEAASIGPDGGSVMSSDGLLVLELPPGALTSETRISIRRVDPDDWPDELAPLPVLGEVYELAPSGLVLDRAATLTQQIVLASTGLEPGEGLPLLAVASRSAGGEWSLLEEVGVSIDETSLWVSARLDHFSQKAVLAGGRTVRIALEPANPRALVGEGFTATVTVSVDSPGVALPIRELSFEWTDPLAALNPDALRRPFQGLPDAWTPFSFDRHQPLDVGSPVRASVDLICTAGGTTRLRAQAAIQVGFEYVYEPDIFDLILSYLGQHLEDRPVIRLLHQDRRAECLAPGAGPTSVPAQARGSATARLAESSQLDLWVEPIEASFDQASQSTTFRAEFAQRWPELVVYEWSGPDCGGPLDMLGNTTETEGVLEYTWHHPHPPCDPSTDHAHVTIRLEVRMGYERMTCTYHGAHSGTGPVCRFG